MQKVKEIAKFLNVVPKLQLGKQLPGGGVKTTGPHTVKFLAEPTSVMGKDDAGKPRKDMRFLVEEAGKQYRWNVPILNKEGQPSYLVERLMDIEVGDVRVLEMVAKRGRNYIDIRAEGDASPDDDDFEEEVVDEEETGAHA